MLINLYISDRTSSIMEITFPSDYPSKGIFCIVSKYDSKSRSTPFQIKARSLNYALFIFSRISISSLSLNPMCKLQKPIKIFIIDLCWMILTLLFNVIGIATFTWYIFFFGWYLRKFMTFMALSVKALLTPDYFLRIYLLTILAIKTVIT